MRFQHVELAPGDYLFYAQLGGMPVPMSAWQQVAVKAGDQLTLDLKIDPARMGKLIVTLPDEEIRDEPVWGDITLIPIPMKFSCSRLYEITTFNVATVKKGQKTVVIKGVPEGKYQATRGESAAVVEVVAGKETSVTLLRTDSNNH